MSDPLRQHLRQALARRPRGALCVAFSAGPDSSALLHALSTLPEARERTLRAVHVDHGLHVRSAAWAQHAGDLCERWQVPLQIHRVSVHNDGGGLEAAAREARYAALQAGLAENEHLLTAQHADDQAETVLLKTLRGAGPHGLAGMREQRPLGRGWLWRPLLPLPRQVLADYVADHGIEAIHDPANTDAAHARSYLRSRVMPLLAAHWPQATQSLGHTAQMQAGLADYLDGQAQVALDALQAADHSLHATDWLALHTALRPLVLERWLHACGLNAPSQAQRAELERQLGAAGHDRSPCLTWSGTQVRRWRKRLYALPVPPELPAGWRATWRGGVLALPGHAGQLAWHPAPAQPPMLEVRLDVPGARIRPAGDRHTREVRDLYQHAGVPPWRRRHCPFLFDGQGRLLAVADLWSSAEAECLYSRIGARPVWRDALAAAAGD